MPLFGLDDDELRRACFGVYTTGSRSFAPTAPSGCIRWRCCRLDDIPLAVSELERCAKMGSRAP